MCLDTMKVRLVALYAAQSFVLNPQANPQSGPVWRPRVDHLSRFTKSGGGRRQELMRWPVLSVAHEQRRARSAVPPLSTAQP